MARWILLLGLFSILVSYAWISRTAVEESPSPALEETRVPPPLAPASLGQPVPSPIKLAKLPPSLRPTSDPISSLEEELAREPKNERTLLALTALYFQNPRLQHRASPLLRRALSVNPENKEVLESYLEMQRDPQSPGRPLQALQELLAENPSSANIAGAYARTLAFKGRYEEAIAVIRRGMEASPPSALAYASLARFYSKAGDARNAAGAYEELVSFQEKLVAAQWTAQGEKELARTLADLATQLIASGQLDRAEAIISTLAAKQPAHPSLDALRKKLNWVRGI